MLSSIIRVVVCVCVSEVPQCLLEKTKQNKTKKINHNLFSIFVPIFVFKTSTESMQKEKIALSKLALASCIISRFILFPFFESACFSSCFPLPSPLFSLSRF